MPARLIFIHGISQDPVGKDALLKTWRQLLLDNATQPKLFEDTPCSMAFYADILGPAAQAAITFSMGAIATGGALSDQDEQAFIGAGLRQMAKAAAISDLEIAAAADQSDKLQVLAQSSAVGRTLVGALAALEHRIPSAGILGVRILKEAYVYLNQPATQSAIDGRVKGELEIAIASGDPLIVVSHSLGTVIAFRSLRELSTAPAIAARLVAGQSPVPLLVTMGSPLAIAAVKSRVGLPTLRPAIVTRWANFYDHGDMVALGQGLSEANFAPGIDNDGDVNNQTANAHSINGYLNHVHVIQVLEDSVSQF